MQPFIAITAGEYLRDGFDWAPAINGVPYTYTDAIIHAGGLPLIIPVVKDDTTLRKLYEQSAAILFSGGQDLNPDTYGVQQLTHNSSPPMAMLASPERDAQELKLLEWALDDDKPVLGICRGMQLINV